MWIWRDQQDSGEKRDRNIYEVFYLESLLNFVQNTLPVYLNPRWDYSLESFSHLFLLGLSLQFTKHV